MRSCWESEKDRLKKHMAIAPVKKLQWLEQMRQLAEVLPKKTREIRKRLKSA